MKNLSVDISFDEGTIQRDIDWTSIAKEGVDMVPALIGHNVIIRTMTMYYVGCLRAVTDTQYLLTSASWIADTGGDNGRWFQTLEHGFGEQAEIEPFPQPVIVSRHGEVDLTLWTHDLPSEPQ